MTDRDSKIAKELKRRLAEAGRLVDFRVFSSRISKVVESVTDVLVRYGIS